MPIRIIQEEKQQIIIEVEGWDRAFCNLIKSELLNDSSVKYAAIRIKHPLIPKPEILIKTNQGTEPIKALIEATKRVSKQAQKFSESFKKAK